MKIPWTDCFANVFVDKKGWGVSLLLQWPQPDQCWFVWSVQILGCWRRSCYWHNTSGPSGSWKSFGGGVEAVPHFHREELVVRDGGERFPSHVCISTCTARFSFTRRVTNVVWSLCCTEHGRGSSAGMGADSSPFSPHYFVTLSWKTAWAATPAWLLSPDLSEQLKASFTHPHPDEYVLCIPTNLLTVLVIQSLALFGKQMPGGWIKHGYRSIALCLKLDLPA